MVSGVRHEYYLDGAQIEAETFGNTLLIYLYDAEGAPIGMQYRTASMPEGQFYTFWFEKNLQGDIIAVYTENGTKIGSYKYDAWGVCTASTESGTTTLQKQIVRTYNPFRYRGYYYDTDTGLYYLQSRYYNPQWGRFLNADYAEVISDGSSLSDKNLFVYCDNNPVMRTDENGEFWHILAGGIIGGVVSATVSAVTQYITTGKVDVGEVLLSAAIGAVTGALSAAGVPLGVMVAVNGVMSAGESLINDIGSDKTVGERIADAAVSGGMSALFTYVGGSSNGKQMNTMYKANKEATKSVLAGGLNPKVKAAAYDSIKTYYKSLGRFIVSEARDSLISSSFNSLSTEIYKAAVKSFIG